MILFNDSWKLLRLIIIFLYFLPILRCCEILTINLCMTWERFFISEMFSHTFHISLQCIVMAWFYKVDSYAYIQYIGFLNQYISIQSKKILKHKRNRQLNSLIFVFCSLPKNILLFKFLIPYRKDSLIAVCLIFILIMIDLLGLEFFFQMRHNYHKCIESFSSYIKIIVQFF